MCDQELRLERMRMALAEAGYPDAAVRWTIEDGAQVVAVDRSIPVDVIWRACVVCREATHCLDCFRFNATTAGFIEVCEHPISLL